MYIPVAAILVVFVIVNATLSERAHALFFGHSIDISNNTKLSSEPHIVLSSKSNVYVVWSDNTTGNGDIYFRASEDNGTTFDVTKTLSNNTGLSSDAKIATSANNVYVVWSDNTTGNGDIYFRASEDNGTTFAHTIRLIAKSGNSQFPQITISEKKYVYVVWSDNTTGNGDIYFRASEDNGTSFNKVKRLSNNTGNSTEPQIATSENNEYVVWSD